MFSVSYPMLSQKRSHRRHFYRVVDPPTHDELQSFSVVIAPSTGVHSMCTYIYIYICTYVYVYIYIHKCKYLHICMCIFIYRERESTCIIFMRGLPGLDHQLGLALASRLRESFHLSMVIKGVFRGRPPTTMWILGNSWCLISGKLTVSY